MDARFAAFVSVSALLIIIPGPDMALVARNALRDGSTGALLTGLGVATGILGWGAAATLGVAALLAQSDAAFALVKLVGAVYLMYLGVQSLRGGLGKPEKEVPAARDDGRPPRRLEAFRQGLLGNLLNPKAAVIFVTIFPQFTRPGDAPLRLALMLLVFEVMILGWLCIYGYALSRAGRSRAGLRLRRALQTVSGAVLIGFGLRLAAER